MNDDENKVADKFFGVAMAFVVCMVVLLVVKTVMEVWK